MMSARLRSQLETANMPPAGALRLNDQQAEALLPVVVEIMDKMTAGAFPLPRQQHLLFHGLHVLAAARCQGLWQPLLRWLRSPYVEVDRALGYGYSGEILPRVALAVFDGDADPLIEAIEDRTGDGYLRWSLFDVFARLVFDGAISREAALALVYRFDQERLADDEDAAWEGWQDVIQLLGIEERTDRVRASWKDGRNSQREVDQQDWEEELRRAVAEPADPARFVEQNIEPLDDAVAALKAVYDQTKSAEESSAIDGQAFA